jgi:hypothetical protein
LTAAEEALRQELLDALLKQGFALDGNRIVPPDLSSKDAVRNLYSRLRRERLREALPWLRTVEGRLLPYFASGSEVNVEHVSPQLVPVDDSGFSAELFRYASLLWSVPVSAGYGRRMRFLVMDRHNGKLIGIFALGDPVYNLRARDEWIGWCAREKNERLAHVMDAYVLGAVPPYSYLLCGKLVALLATSNEVREAFRKKYAGQASLIRGVVREPHLVLLTTTSALGRSSLYNRIALDGRRVFLSLGFTEGWGHFHFSDGTFERIKAYLREVGDPVVARYKYGGGPNWRMRALKSCLVRLGLSPQLLQHGVRREVFGAPLAANAREFLRGEDAEPQYYDMHAQELFAYFRRRWLLPRAARDGRFREFDRESIRMSRMVEREVGDA